MVSWGDVSSVVQYSPRGKDVARKPPVQALVQKVEEVDTRKLDWSVVCYIQFLCVPMSQAQAIISVAPQIQLLVSAGARHRLGTAKGPEDDDVARETPSNNILDVSFWPPRKPKQHKVTEPKTAQERAKEGVIISSKQNKNLQHRQIVEVESRKANTHKFGNRCDSGEDDKAATDSA